MMLDDEEVAICEHCRKVIRRGGTGIGHPWIHADGATLYCPLPAPEATPASGINADEIAALNTYARRRGI